MSVDESQVRKGGLAIEIAKLNKRHLGLSSLPKD